MRKFAIVAGLVVVIALTLALVRLGTAESPDHSLGAAFFRHNNDPQANRVVMRVNGKPVTQADSRNTAFFVGLEKASRGQSSQVTNQETIQRIVRDAVIHEESERRGLMPTGPEIDQYLDGLRQAQAEAFRTNPGMKQQFQGFLSGLQQTEAEYWARSRPIYARQLASSRLRQAIGHDQVDFSQMTPDNIAELQKRYNQRFETFVDDLVKSAKVEILDDSIR